MKKCLIILLVIFMATPLLAQEETLVGRGIHSGGYGGPVWKVGLVNGKTGLFSGGRGGWIINHKFAIGGGGYSMITDVEADGQLYLDMEYGGFEMEYIHKSNKLIHWTIHTLLGAGTVKLKEHDPRDDIESDRFYLIEPSFNFDFNVADWFRIGLGASYRLAFGVDMSGVTSSDVSGPSGLIILKFGSF